jgi:hypothetical protein
MYLVRQTAITAAAAAAYSMVSGGLYWLKNDGTISVSGADAPANSIHGFIDTTDCDFLQICGASKIITASTANTISASVISVQAWGTGPQSYLNSLALSLGSTPPAVRLANAGGTTNTLIAAASGGAGLLVSGVTEASAAITTLPAAVPGGIGSFFFVPDGTVNAVNDEVHFQVWVGNPSLNIDSAGRHTGGLLQVGGVSKVWVALRIVPTSGGAAIGTITYNVWANQYREVSRAHPKEQNVIGTRSDVDTADVLKSWS